MIDLDAVLARFPCIYRCLTLKTFWKVLCLYRGGYVDVELCLECGLRRSGP